MPAFIEQCQDDMSRVIEFGAEGYMIRDCAFTERHTERDYGSNTLEEIARYLGYRGQQKDTFLKSLERYN